MLFLEVENKHFQFCYKWNHETIFAGVLDAEVWASYWLIESPVHWHCLLILKCCNILDISVLKDAGTKELKHEGYNSRRSLTST